jgi:hypothetical protein
VDNAIRIRPTPLAGPAGPCCCGGYTTSGGVVGWELDDGVRRHPDASASWHQGGQCGGRGMCAGMSGCPTLSVGPALAPGVETSTAASSRERRHPLVPSELSPPLRGFPASPSRHRGLVMRDEAPSKLFAVASAHARWERWRGRVRVRACNSGNRRREWIRRSYPGAPAAAELGWSLGFQSKLSVVAWPPRAAAVPVATVTMVPG